MKLFAVDFETVTKGDFRRRPVERTKPLFNESQASVADIKLQVERLQDVMNGNHVMRCCAKADCTFK